MVPLIKRIGATAAGAALAAVVCVGAMTMSAKPAEARIWVGVNFGYPGYYAPSYYYPAYYPYYGYYRPYWRHHRRYVHYRRWHHRHWCHWHPYRCYW